jgi:phosphoribosylformylglycinamidine (FGAM) synthase PurS component
MTLVEAAIESIVADNTAFTALTALQGLGYAELARAERAELLELRLDASGHEAAEIVRGVMRAEVVFNPNKHRLSYRVVAPSARANAGDAVRSPSHPAWEAVVADRDDDPSRLVQLLRAHFGIASLQTMTRATRWRLFESARPSSKERLEWACLQLLANPYSQVWSVRAAAPMIAAPR